MKRCSKCKKEKPFTDFSKNKAAPCGYANQCKTCARTSNKESYLRSGHAIKRAKAYLRLYGITIEQYNEMFEKQGGKCAICGRHQSEFRTRLCVDHCHKTNRVRELLCQPCNAVLGQIESFLPMMLPYLEKHAKMD